MAISEQVSPMTNVVAVLFIATVVKILFNLAGDNGVNWDDPQHSILSSRLKGVYVCPVQADPKTFLWNGTTISFKEIWIEHRVHTDHPYTWFRRTTPSGGDYLCFTINPEHLVKAGSPFFICSEGDFGGGVSWINEGLLFDSWLKPDAFGKHEANLRLVKDWNDLNSTKIKLTW